MSSQISPTSINTQFPVAGVNNNTQGFRDNFTAIQNNFTFAQQDINDLLNKAVVTAPLTNGNAAVSNNFNGLPLMGPVLSWFSFAIVNHGTLTTTATENFDFSLGYIHSVTLNGASAITSVNPINVPKNGSAPISIQLAVTNNTHQLNFSGLANLTAFSVPGFNAATGILSFNTTGNYFYTLSTPDNGGHWQLSAPNSSAQAEAYVPSSSKGTLGDTAGMIAYSNSNIYICTSNYTGNSNIWVRSSLVTF